MKQSVYNMLGDKHWIGLSINNLSGVNTAIPPILLDMVLFRGCRGIFARTVNANLPTTMLYPK